jgi:Mg-chelatase subunit ChlD
MLGASTNLARALAFARVADVAGIRFVVISDGQPDDEKAALAEAAQYKAPISTVYVGPEGERSGREFLERLASSRGGRSLHADRAQELAAAVQTLMLAAR